MDEQLRIITNDGKDFTVLAKAALLSPTIQSVSEDAHGDIHLPGVDGTCFEIVMRYANAHKDDTTPLPTLKMEPSKRPEQPERVPDVIMEVSEADKEFCKDFSKETLFELSGAADYLDMAPLFDLICQKIAFMVKEIEPDKIPAFFGEKPPEGGDYPPEAYEKMYQENKWFK